MYNLSKAIWGKLAASNLSAHIANRLFKGRAPEGSDYPYIVYLIVTNEPEKTFTEDFEHTTIQFSLFSILSSSTEVENMYTDLKTLYDECAMAITGSTLIWMKRVNASLMIEDHTVKAGVIQVWHYAVDYTVMTSLD